MRLLKQSSTAQPLVFLMIDSTDHITGKTGLTVTATLSKAGGSFASPSGTVSEIGSGWYKVAGNATDTNTLGGLVLHATATGADPTDVYFDVLAVDPQSSAFGLSLAKTTNLTGFNDIASTDVWAATTRTLSAGTNIQLPSNGLANVTAWTVGLTGNITGNLSGSVGSVTGLTASNLDATISSRLASGSYSAPPSAASISTQVWSETIRVLTAGTNIALAKGTGLTGLNDIAATDVVSAGAITTSSGAVTVGTNNDKAGYTLSAPGVTAVQSGLSTYSGGDTSGTTTLLARLTGTRATLIDNLDATISSRSSYAGTDTSGTTTLLARLTSIRAGYLDNLSGGPTALASGVLLSASQTLYAPSLVGSAMTLTTGERTAIANEVEAQIIDDTDSEKVLTAITDKIASVNPSLGALTLSAIAASVWTNGTRTLTAGTNIVLAKGTGVTGFTDIDSSGVATATGTALATVGLTTTVTSRIDAAISTRMATFSYTAPPTAAANASAVRTELTTELGRVDVAISSRMATFSFTAAPTAASVATAVRSELTTELGRVDAPVTSRMATFSYTPPPTAAAVASATRAELTTELGRMDASVSSRLASGSYVAPATPSNVTAAQVAILAAISGITSGGSTLTGPSAVTLTFTDSAGHPVPFVDFLVVGAGLSRTTETGSVTFGLVNGTYSIIARQTSEIIFPAHSIVVNGATSLSVAGSAVVIPPVSPIDTPDLTQPTRF